MSYLQATLYYFVYFINILSNNEVFDDFPKISDHFPKIFLMLSEGHTNVFEHFPNFSEDRRGRSEDVSEHSTSSGRC